MATMVQSIGATIDYTPSSDVSSGDVVVQGELVGVATRDISADASGTLTIEGVFSFDKSTGSSTAITAGANCYWDASEEVATTTVGSNKLIGKCILAASDDDTTVRIKLNQ